MLFAMFETMFKTPFKSDSRRFRASHAKAPSHLPQEVTGSGRTAKRMRYRFAAVCTSLQQFPAALRLVSVVLLRTIHRE